MLRWLVCCAPWVCSGRPVLRPVHATRPKPCLRRRRAWCRSTFRGPGVAFDRSPEVGYSFLACSLERPACLPGLQRGVTWMVRDAPDCPRKCLGFAPPSKIWGSFEDPPRLPDMPGGKAHERAHRNTPSTDDGLSGPSPSGHRDMAQRLKPLKHYVLSAAWVCCGRQSFRLQAASPGSALQRSCWVSVAQTGVPSVV